MTYRIGWLSPLTPTSGVGTFSDAIAKQFPSDFGGEAIDLTILYVGHDKLYRNAHRSIRIRDGDDFRQILTLFDLLVYNIGNNREHHEAIFTLLRQHPGIVISHDYVYQHVIAERSLRSGKTFASFAALLLAYGDASTPDYLRRSRITSRTGVRYSPWDSEASVEQPMSDALLSLGSGLVVHSSFAQKYAERCFDGPILQLGMPHDQKPEKRHVDLSGWTRRVIDKDRFELVSFGHVQATKCIDLIIAAIAASPVLRRRVRYTVAGFVPDIVYFERLRAMVATLSLQDCVFFERDVSDRRLDELMQMADVFSNLRRPNTEGASVSLIEQLDTGKPVIVINSGCYRDVPADAAVKLPSDVDSQAIRLALERLVADPGSMSAVGRQGQVYARRWTCASYAQELLRFAFDNRDLLQQRARIGATSRSLEPIPRGADDAWTRDLARARLRLTYLDHNVLAVDPSIILQKTKEALSEYVAHVLFGIFGNAQLEAALSRFFSRLDRRATYWACVRLAILADAVLGENEAARERLVNLRPCHDPDFWLIIEALPARQCMAAATHVLARRAPKTDELCVTGLDDQDGFPKRLRIAELVREIKPPLASSLALLGRCLLEPCCPTIARELPPIETDAEWDVGSAAFKERVDLSGFYAMESDHAWTRGHRGFLGLRLGARAAALDVLVYHICASAERPASIRLSCGSSEIVTEVRDCTPRWLSIALPPTATGTRTVWLLLSTDAAAVPASPVDTRLLGLCCLRLRAKIDAGIPARPESRSLVATRFRPFAARSAPSGSRRNPLAIDRVPLARLEGLGSALPGDATRRLGKYWQVLGQSSRSLPIKQCALLLSKLLMLSGRTFRKGLPM